MGYYVILSLEDERYFSFDDHLLYEKGIPAEKDLKGIAFYVYKYLATHSPNYIDRDRIFDDVWVLEMKKNRPRNQASYRDKIPLLRKYLGDTAEPFKYIESDGNYRYRSKQRAFYTDDIDAYIREKKAKEIVVPVSSMSVPQTEAPEKGYKFSDFVLNLKTGQPELDIEIPFPDDLDDIKGLEYTPVYNREKGCFEEIITFDITDAESVDDSLFITEEELGGEIEKSDFISYREIEKLPVNAIFSMVTRHPRYSAFEDKSVLKNLFLKNKRVRINNKVFKVVDMVSDDVCVLTDVHNSWSGGFYQIFKNGLKTEFIELGEEYQKMMEWRYKRDFHSRILCEINVVDDFYGKEDGNYEELTEDNFYKLSPLQVIVFLSTNYKYTYLSTQPIEEVLMLKLKTDLATKQYFNLVDTIFVEGKNVAVLINREKTDLLFSYFTEEDGNIRLDIIEDEALIKEVESEYMGKAFDRVKSGVRNINEIKYPTT